MTIAYPWTFDLIRARAQFVVERRRKRRHVDTLLISLAVTIWTLIESGHSGMAALAILVLIARACYIYLPPFWLDFLSASVSKKETPTQSLTLSETGLVLQRPPQDAVMVPWTLLSELIQTDTLYFLCDLDTGAIVVPKSAFETDEARGEFETTVERHLTGARDERAKTLSTLPLGR